MNALSLSKTIAAELAVGRSSNWRLARALSDFHRSRGWVELGFETMGDYLISIGLTRTAYYRLICIEETFGHMVTPAQMKCLAFSKLSIATNGVSAGVVTRAAALRDCEELTAREMRVKYAFQAGHSAQARRMVMAMGRIQANDAVIDVLLSLLEDSSITDQQARSWAIDLCKDSMTREASLT